MTPAEIFHLYSRAVIGVPLEPDMLRHRTDRASLVDRLFSESKNHTPLKPDLDELAEEKTPTRDFRKKLREKQHELNILWMQRLISGQEALREKMTLFWHNHFACRVNHPHLLLDLNNTCRELAFAPFKELLLAVSKSPAMLLFLNNQQNRKQHPNENFARELMELFTIGRGHYTETDIREAARAFTGWGFNRKTRAYVFRSQHHDDGIKTFMSKEGYFKGEEIIDMILEKKETAVFLCKKIVRHFVHDRHDAPYIKELADYYYSVNYDTGKLMQRLFLSDEFYAKENMGALIKSPVELLVGLSKTFNIQYTQPQTLLGVQRLMGQVLFYPPNVAGWPGGRNWIDSSTLMFRLKLPSILINDGVIDMETKEDMDEDFMDNMTAEMKMRKKTAQRTGTVVNWDEIESRLPGDPDSETLAAIFVRVNPGSEKLKMLEKDSSRRELIVKIVSLPEYQLG